MSNDGKSAKIVNGSANANAKPNIPTAGANISPDVETSTRRKPIIGPVHEKDTSTRVNAMRNILKRPDVLLAFSSTLFVQEDGNVSSNPPRNDAPNTTSIRKKNILNTALVDRALSAPAPNTSVTAIPSNRYITTIEIPYMAASRIA